MREFLRDGFHVFLVVLFSLFFVFTFMGLGGVFDSWTNRYIRLKERFRRRRRQQRMG